MNDQKLDESFGDLKKSNSPMRDNLANEIKSVKISDSSPTSLLRRHSDNTGFLLPWDKFNYWVNAILVVTFDIEMGQSLESIYPSANQVKLTQNEKANICYMSFPDSNSGFLGDTQYHFRLKQDFTSSTNTSNTNNPTISSNGLNGNLNTFASNLNNLNNHPNAKPINQSNSVWLNKSNLSKYDEYNSKTLPGLEVDKNHLFGYVYFRQVKDKSLKRGYFQKSVVLLSKFPFVNFFNEILGLIAVEFFSTGNEVLETACHDIDQWPLPLPGELISLPILGNLIEVCLPVKIDKYTLPVIYRKEFPSIASTLPPVHEVNIYKCLEPILIHIHLLWELIILNEPIVVIANVPNTCSETVQALISTVWPLKYASDYRPFFTIHNTEFIEYSSKNHSPPGLVIGVTNPFFTKCLQHWPNIIKIAEIGSKKSPEENTQKSSSQTTKQAKIKKTSSIRVVDTKPAVYTCYQSFLNKNKEILKSLIRGTETNRPIEAQSAILRRHFIELTQSFIIPLERYFSSLMPLHKNISPFKSVPKLKEFDTEEFLRNLKQATPELTPTLKGDWAGLYRRFFDSLNFKYWYEQKQKEAIKKLEQLQLQLLSQYDIKKWLQGKHEIEIIDQFINVKKKLDLIETNQLEANEEIRLRIKSILSQFSNALPEDMKLILPK